MKTINIFSTTDVVVFLGSHWFIELQLQSAAEIGVSDLHQCIRRVHCTSQDQGFYLLLLLLLIDTEGPKIIIIITRSCSRR